MVLQLIVNGLVAGGLYALVAVGFGLIYSTARFFNFAHGTTFAWAAYAAFALGSMANLPMGVALVGGAVFGTLLGIGTESWVYRPMRRRNSSGLVLLIVSLGLYTVLQNVISLIFGDSVKSLRTGAIAEGVTLGPATITPVQVYIVATAVVLICAVSGMLAWTRSGKAIRAIASDMDLALVSGIDAERTVLLAFAVGSALAAVAGVLAGLDVGMVPTMGAEALMMGIVASLVGGVGSAPGAALGGLLLGEVQQLGIWHIGSEWQGAVAFALLLLFLLLRPQGIMGRRSAKAAV